MIKKSSLLLVLLLVLLSCSACGNEITTEEYHNLKGNYDSLQEQHDTLCEQYDSLCKQYDKLKEEYNTLKISHDKLLSDSSEFLRMTENEQAAALAQAEADRINAENAAKEAKEKQEAAAKAAAEEAARIAEENAAAEATEQKKGYETGISYDNLARHPNDYEGKKVKFKGKVLQVLENNGETQIRLATKNSGYGIYYEDVILGFFPSNIIDYRVLENDIITVYGVSMNLYTYDAVMGNSVTIPLVQIDKID